MLDDLLVGARGARVRCTECGTVFRVTPAAGSSLAQLGATLTDEAWRVNRVSGEQLEFASVSELSRAILAGQVVEDDVLSRGLLPARRLGEVLELSSFFARARRPDPDERIPTLPGLVDPAQRAAVERARAEIERLKREAAIAAIEPPTAPAPPVAPVAPALASSIEPQPVLAIAPAPSRVEPDPSPAPASILEPVRMAAALAATPEPTPDEGIRAVPEAAVSPPILPDVDSEPPESFPVEADDDTGRRARARERAEEARRARLRHGVLSLLGAAALVLVAGLGVQAWRRQPAPERALATTAPVVSAPVAPPESVPTEPVPAEATPPVHAAATPPSPSAEPAAPEAPASASPSPSAELHRGDPQTLPPIDPRRMVADGARALRHGELRKAEEAFQRAISKNPYDSEALSGLGDLARVRGQADKAREIYAQVLTMNPSYLPALLALGDLAWSSGDRQEAIKNYEYIVSHYPESAYPARVRQRAGEEASQ